MNIQSVIDYFNENGPGLPIILILFAVFIVYIRKDILNTKKYHQKNRKSLEETYVKPLVFENRVIDHDKLYRVVKSEGTKVHIDIHEPHENDNYRVSVWKYRSYWFVRDSVPKKILETENEWFAFVKP